jgi:hypothetical protein
MIIEKEEILIPGIPEREQLNYWDHPQLKLKMGEDMRVRKTRWIRSIIAHNTKAIATQVKPGKGPETRLEERIAHLWATDQRHAGAHIAIDWDGTVACLCDLLCCAAYHAGPLNEVSIGFELYEDSQGNLYEHQLDVSVIVTDFLTEFFQVQRQCPPSIDNRDIKRLVRGGRDIVGVFGHCHAYAGKPNDPGTDYFRWLEKAGYEVLNFRVQEDLHVWKSRQQKLGFEGPDLDGIPGPMTIDALQAAGYYKGLWSPPEDPTSVS